ncbi:MAG: hypothetical protein ABI467_00455 [Kofleriaceae bacterium]
MRYLLAALLVSTSALADGILVKGDYPRVDVEVGKTVEQPVGYHRYRWFCDDPSLLTGDLVTRGDTNYFVITGVKAGSTQCRVGTDREGYTVMDVYVSAAKPAPPHKVKP